MVKKLYNNEQWLRYQIYYAEKKPEDIAQMCNVDLSTIYRAMKKFKIR